MGTTLTAAYIADDTLFLGHVGHSRAYLLRDGMLTQLTRDQTLAQRLGAGGRAAPTELAAHDIGHILTDAIGGWPGRQPFKSAGSGCSPKTVSCSAPTA